MKTRDDVEYNLQEHNASPEHDYVALIVKLVIIIEATTRNYDNFAANTTT